MIHLRMLNSFFLKCGIKLSLATLSLGIHYLRPLDSVNVDHFSAFIFIFVRSRLAVDNFGFFLLEMVLDIVGKFE